MSNIKQEKNRDETLVAQIDGHFSIERRTKVNPDLF